MNKLLQLKIFGVVSLLCSFLSACQPDASEDATWLVTEAHIKTMPPGQTRAAAYLTLHNTGAQDRQILHVEADIAGEVQVHRHTYEQGMMKMRRVQHPRIPAGEQLVFAPGGFHLMLLDVDQPPSEGDTFSITMEFDGGESVTFPVAVRPL